MPMTVPVFPFASRSNLVDIIQDLSQYLSHQKKMGITRMELSSLSLEILTSWGQESAPRMGFRTQGPSSAKVLLVDGKDLFFTGDAGRLLKKILGAMNLAPESVSICNATGSARVKRHVGIIQPDVIIALGDTAVWILTSSRSTLESVRGQFFDFHGIPVMPTFHPAQLIEEPALKRPVWDDMQQVMKILGMPS